MAGGQAIKFVTLNDATTQAGNWVPELVAATPAGPRRTIGAGAHRPVQLRRGRGHDPDHQRGRGAGDQPVEHRDRAHHGGPGASRASRTSTTRPASAPTSASCPTTTSRPTRSPPRCATPAAARRRRPRRRGLRQGRGDADAARGRAPRDEGRPHDADRQQHAALRLDQGRLRRLHRHHRQRRRADVRARRPQGEAVRLRRRRRDPASPGTSAPRSRSG